MRRAGWFLLFLFPTCLGVTADDPRPVEVAPRTADEKPARPDLPSLFIVGDSTVGAVSPGKVVGWGQRIETFFDTSRINVVNRAIGGRSSRTFRTEGRWERVLEDLEPGDFVVIQFGHNDAGTIGDPAAQGRPSLPGLGDETATDTRRDGSTEVVHTFGWYLAHCVDEARARGATVILCSPIPHKQAWAEERDWADYAQWAETAAREHGAMFIDLTMVITKAYRRMGREAVEPLFAGGSHTNDAGARVNARCVVAGLKALPGDPLAGFWSVEGKSVDACAE